jgi:hypothetical protein
MKKSKLAVTGFVILASSAVVAPAEALTFNTTYNDADINTYFGSNAGAYKTDIGIAESAFTSVFSDPITINITFGATNTGLGASSTFLNFYTGSQIKTAATADATSSSDQTSVNAGGSLNSGPPSTSLWVTTANAKALGLASASNASDGTVTINGTIGLFYGTTPGAGDTSNYGLISVLEHEISEVMGRIGISGGNVTAPNQYSLLDAFSYSAPGTRSPGNGGGNYFSIDGGTTAGLLFNNESANGGDSRDWANTTLDAFNAFGAPGVVAPLSATDFQVMDVLGYNLAAAVPEPETYAMMLAGLGLLGIAARRRKQKAA